MASRVHIATLVLAAGVLASSCQDAAPAGSVSEGEAVRFRAAMDGLCQTRNFIELREYSAGRDTFASQTHQYLHDLAPRVQEEDAGAAGELLEAKQQVEQVLRDPGFYGQELLVRRVVELEEALRRAGAVVGLPEAGCGA